MAEALTAAEAVATPARVAAADVGGALLASEVSVAFDAPTTFKLELL